MQVDEKFLALDEAQFTSRVRLTGVASLEVPVCTVGSREEKDPVTDVGEGGGTLNDPITQGWRFTTQQDLVLTTVKWYYNVADDEYKKQLGIWNLTNPDPLLVVEVRDTDPIDGIWRRHELSANEQLYLPAGHTYFIGGYLPQPPPPASPVPREILSDEPTFDPTMLRDVLPADDGGGTSGLTKPSVAEISMCLGVVSFDAAVLTGEDSKLTAYGSAEFKSGLAVASGGGALSTGNNGVYCGDASVSNSLNVGVGGVQVASGSIVIQQESGGDPLNPVVSPGTAGEQKAHGETIGWRFTPVHDFIITQLRWTTESTFDPENPFHIGIWDDKVAEPIFQTTITNDEISGDGKWATKDVSTPILRTGRNYWIAGLLTSPNTIYNDGTPSWDSKVVDNVVMGNSVGTSFVLTKPTFTESDHFGPVTFLCKALETTVEVKADGSITANSLDVSSLEFKSIELEELKVGDNFSVDSNGDVKALSLLMSGMPGMIRGRNAGAQSISNNSDVGITWSTTNYVAGGAEASPSAAHIKVPVRGLYYVFYTISWQDAESGIRNSNIRRTGDTGRYARINIGPLPSGGQPICLSASEMLLLEADDTLYLEVYQDSGDPLNCMIDDGSCRFGALCLYRLPPPED